MEGQCRGRSVSMSWWGCRTMGAAQRPGDTLGFQPTSDFPMAHTRESCSEEQGMAKSSPGILLVMEQDTSGYSGGDFPPIMPEIFIPHLLSTHPKFPSPSPSSKGLWSILMYLEDISPGSMASPPCAEQENGITGYLCCG